MAQLSESFMHWSWICADFLCSFDAHVFSTYEFAYLKMSLVVWSYHSKQKSSAVLVVILFNLILFWIFASYHFVILLLTNNNSAWRGIVTISMWRRFDKTCFLCWTFLLSFYCCKRRWWSITKFHYKRMKCRFLLYHHVNMRRAFFARENDSFDTISLLTA